MSYKKVEVGVHSYEITSEFVRSSEDEYSCTSDCLYCGRNCEHGLAMKEKFLS